MALVEGVVEDCGRIPCGDVQLEDYVSPNFMGFFVREGETVSSLRTISNRAAKELSSKLSKFLWFPVR